MFDIVVLGGGNQCSGEGTYSRKCCILVSITVIPGETKVDGKLLRLSINKQIIERAFSAWSACTTLQTKRKWASILRELIFY